MEDISPSACNHQVIENMEELFQAVENVVGPSSPTKGIKSFFGNMTPDLTSYFKQGSSSKAKKTCEKHSPETLAHAMVDIKSVARSTGPKAKSVRIHTMAECNTVEMKNKKVMSEHSLTDCGTIVVGGQRSSNASMQQMSYVHDFTDCPVDRDILEYVEREEKRSQEHELDGCLKVAFSAREDSGSGPAHGPTEAPAMPECGAEGSARKDTQQHRLDDCTRSNSIVLEGVEQHILGDCSRISSVASEVVQQHHLNDCTLLSSIASVTVKDIVHRQAPEVSRARSQKAEANQAADHRQEEQLSSSDGFQEYRPKFKTPGFTKSAVIEEFIGESSEHKGQQIGGLDCCDLDSEEANTPQHRLSTCSQDVSLGESDQQHRLSECSPPTEILNNTQHRLSTCSPDVSSEEGGQHHRLSECSPSNLSTGQSTPQHRDSAVSQPALPLAISHSQNRFWPFARSSSASALVISKKDQERASQGTRSISMPVSAQKKAEDPIEDASRRSSMTITPPKRFFSAASHTLENCRCGDSSEDSHHSVPKVPESDTIDHGKQPAIEIIEAVTQQAVEVERHVPKKSEPSIGKAEQSNHAAGKSASDSQQPPKPVTVRRRAIGKTEPEVRDARKGDQGVRRAVSSGVRPTRVIKKKTSLGSQRVTVSRNSLGTQVIKRIELSKQRSVSSGASSTRDNKKIDQGRQRAVSSGVLPIHVVKRADKGKQRAHERSESTSKAFKNATNGLSDEEVVCDNCERANAEPAEVKPKAVIVSVDVIVGGKKMRTAAVGSNLDGHNSPRPSVVHERLPQSSSLRSHAVRERSAQTALQNVLATSQKNPGYGEADGSVRRHSYQRYARSRLPHHNENYENSDGVVVLGTPGPISAAIHQAEQTPRRDSDAESLQTSIASGILSAVTGLGRRSR